jgi:hypothetical protein
MTDRNGIIIINNNNKIVIDEDFKTFCIHSMGTINLIPGLNKLAVSPSSKTPILLTLKYSTVGYCAWTGMTINDSSITEAHILSSNTMSVNYMILKAGIINTLPDYGAAFYDSSGNVIFSAGEGYPNLINQAVMNVTFSSSGGANPSSVIVSSTNNYFLPQGILWVAGSAGVNTVQYRVLGYKAAPSGMNLILTGLPWFSKSDSNQVSSTCSLNRFRILEFRSY